jgi:hypothetical protein
VDVDRAAYVSVETRVEETGRIRGDAPLANVGFDTLVSPVHRMPSCDQTGVPIHFTPLDDVRVRLLMSLRTLPVFRASPQLGDSLRDELR